MNVTAILPDSARPFWRMAFLSVLVSAFAAALQAAGVPPPAGDVQFPAEEVRRTAREWKLQPFEPEDARRRIEEVSIDEFDDGLGMSLDDAPAAKAAPKDEPPPLQWPTEAAPYWGWFRFESGAWWATTMLMKEANTLQFELPSSGVEHEQHGYNNVWLRTFETVDQSWSGKSVLFVIDGLKGCDANLYVNRKPAGTIHRPGGELDISALLKPGEKNELLLLVSANGYQIAPVRNATYMGLPKGGGYKAFQKSSFNLTGSRPRLVVRPETYISDVFANTSWRRKRLDVEVSVSTARDLDGATLFAEVFDADGKLVKSAEMKFDARGATGSDAATIVTTGIPWDDPITWEFGRGYLYTLRTSIDTGDGKRIGCKDVRFGFREIWRDGRKIYMNGHEQKFRMCYNFGAGLLGAEFLSQIGYNVIQYAHNNRDIDPSYDVNLLYGLAEKGMGCAIATTQIFWDRRNSLLSDKDVRADYERLLAKNLRRYRNIPSVVMCYMGVNINIQNWTQDALHLGSGASGQFDKLINELAASAHRTNPNALFYSHGDGINGDIATANLYLNWIPLQERFEWPSRWAVRGNFPFQAAEFGHPYQMTWGRDGHHDVVSELLAIYYGDEAYRQEPQSIRVRHGDNGLLYIRRMQHPLYWRFLDEFVWGVNRFWRTFGINGGVVWFNLDQGFGMPGWKLYKIWNEYSPNYSEETFKKIGGVPRGRPDWAFPSWDIYQRGNKDFLGYLGGWPRHTDSRHAYREGDQVVKQIVMLDDSFAPGEYSARWEAFCRDEAGGRQPIASGVVERRQLESNVPLLERISFVAPQVQGGGLWTEEPRKACLEVEFLDSRGKSVGKDSFPFEIYPRIPYLAKPADAKVALFDPRGNTGAWLRKFGISGVRKIESPEAIGDATHLIIGSFALESNDFAVATSAVEGGLKVLVMEQSADAWGKFGFTAYDAAPRRLWLRDTSNKAFSGVADRDLHDWAGQPQVPPGARTFDGQIFGHLAKGQGPRWTRNMAVASLVLRTPDVVGYLPQVEGEFDMNMSALLMLRRGKGSVQFCTLSLEDRTLPFPAEAPGDPAPGQTPPAPPVDDPACDSVARALLRDFLAPAGAVNSRTVVPLGPDARRLAGECGLAPDGPPGNASTRADEPRDSLLLVGPGADIGWATIKKEIDAGAAVLVFANEKIAAEAGFSFGAAATNYCAAFNPSNAALRGIGQNLLRWRSMMFVRPFVKTPSGFSLDIDGLLAASDDGRVVFTQIDPFQIERRLSPEGGVASPMTPQADEEEDPAPVDDIAIDLEDGQSGDEDGKASDGDKAVRLKVASMTIEHGYQFFSRLMTNLGAAAPAQPRSLYNLPFTAYDPYFFKYW